MKSFHAGKPVLGLVAAGMVLWVSACETVTESSTGLQPGSGGLATPGPSLIQVGASPAASASSPAASGLPSVQPEPVSSVSSNPRALATASPSPVPSASPTVSPTVSPTPLPSSRPTPTPQATGSSPGVQILADAFKNKTSNFQVQSSGLVTRILADDNDGSRHQRFILKLSSGQTLLIAHNLDLAPRISTLKTGDKVEFYGEYEWNDQGGVIHWTHKDPARVHPDGWLRHQGTTYE